MRWRAFDKLVPDRHTLAFPELLSEPKSHIQLFIFHYKMGLKLSPSQSGWSPSRMIQTNYLISILLFFTFCQASQGNVKEEIGKPGSSVAHFFDVFPRLFPFKRTILNKKPLINQYHSTLLRQLKRDSPVYDSSVLRQIKRHFSSSMFPSPSLRRLHKDMTRAWRIVKKE